MKGIILVVGLVMFASLFAFADVDIENVVKVTPSEHTCAEMQTIIARDGMILIKGLLGYYDYHFRNGSYCNYPYTRVYISYDTSLDQTWCMVGYVCGLKP